ncbi:MAG: glycosyltransferase family 4 protein [Pirellulales bacterium]
MPPSVASATPRLPDPQLNRIAFVGNYVPRRCGIATYTRDLRCAVAEHLPGTEALVVSMNDAGGPHAYPEEVRFECADQDVAAYQRAADFLNLANVDVVSLQHEYGIFGGEAGSHVLALLRGLRAPVHTTLHTVLAEPEAAQRRVMSELIHLSVRLAVMTERGRTLLRAVYGVADDRIDVIPHGIPDMEFVDPSFHKDRFGLESAHVLLTFGLLSPNKGIEHVIRALPDVVARHPRVVYAVLGATHPHLVREQGEHYREGLVQLVNDLGMQNHVVFHDRYADMPELLAFLGAADIYVTPYLAQDQITSGTLAYAFGCGKAVLSTPYWHAAELLADGRGVLVPFRDPAAVATAICELLEDEARRHAMRKRAWLLGREMVWGRVAERYVDAFARTRRSTIVKPRRSEPTRLPHRDLTPLVLDHLWRLSDSTGVLQHATYDVPSFTEGYCTDDNARALGLMVLVEELGLETRRSVRATAAYAAFLDHAFEPRTGRFRNFLGIDRRWLDDAGSDDCLGRAVHALGLCIGRSRRESLRAWALRLFDPAMRAVAGTTSPRAWALAILGIQEYLRRLSGDRLACGILRELVDRLVRQQRTNAGPDWPWLEDVVAYENARLCQALISAGRWTGDADALDTGLVMLEWLWGIQRSSSGRFAPIGCHGFYPRGGKPAAFDQQPLEAQAMVAACIEALHAVRDDRWRDRAWAAFEWFRGHNLLGMALCDPLTGGCRDGLLADRLNENQGAESTLAWLHALADMTSLESSRCTSPVPASSSGRTMPASSTARSSPPTRSGR